MGIRQIFARSPQAKGRVERTAGTFQDRLVTELRLAGVITIDEANEVLHRFLPRFNEKFGVPAEHSSVAYRSMESSVSLDQILCFKHRRKVARDNTVKPTFPIWLNIPLSKSSAFFKPLSICETLAVGMAIITP